MSIRRLMAVLASANPVKDNNDLHVPMLLDRRPGRALHGPAAPRRLQRDGAVLPFAGMRGVGRSGWIVPVAGEKIP